MLLQILVMLLFLAIFIGLLIYVSWRLKYLFGIPKKRHVYIPVISTTVTSILFVILLSFTSGTFVYVIYRILSVWMGLFLFLVCFLAVFEIVNGVFILFKKKVIPRKIRILHHVSIPKRISGIIVVILTVLTSVYGIWNAYDLDVEHVDLEFDNFNGTVNIAVLSDIHIGSSGGKGFLERLVKKTNSLDPDIVLIAGDIADSNGYLDDDMFSPLKEIKAPVYFVTGNHETMIDEKKILEILERNDVRVLKNEIVEIHGLQLVGLRYMSSDSGGEDLLLSEDNQTIESVMPTLNISENSPAILMHHNPVGIPYAQAAGIDLYIAGHTHGGQFFPMTIIAEPLTSDYYKGLYHYRDMDVYVSQGSGFWFIPMRVGTHSEITMIHLRGNAA